VQAIVERQPAFEAFYRLTRPEALRTVVFVLNDLDLAVDAVDEALARAYERWDTLAESPNLTGWVIRVAVNFGRNRQRRRLLERRKPLVSRDADPDLAAVADPALARALARLDFDQRTVVVLRYHLDWSVEQVAAALEIPPGTVKSRLHRGLRRLETLLEETR
jgi:RNA polymerase sigma-70 factor (ECF subfamily)